AGIENPSGACFQQYLDRAITEGVYASTCLYNGVNDNADPNILNAAGFQFLILDWQIDHLLLPLKQRVEARNEKLAVYLRYGSGGSSSALHRNPDEYSELIQA